MWPSNMTKKYIQADKKTNKKMEMFICIHREGSVKINQMNKYQV